MPDTMDGHVTLAILGAKMDMLLAANQELRLQVDAIRSCQDKMSWIPGDVNELKEKVDVLQTDVEALKTKTNILGGLSGLGSMAAAIIGSLFNPNR